jgi:hypothetical protein
MRASIVLLSVSLFGLAAPCRAEDDREARAVLDRAVKALGGKKLLLAEGSLSGKSKGEVVLNGNKSAVSNEWVVQGTDRLKWSSEVTLNDKPISITIGLDRGKGWIQAGNGKANDLPKDYLPAFRVTFAGLRLVENPSLLPDKGVKLSHLGEIKIDDRAAVGVKVIQKGVPDLEVYCDKKSHLPVKAVMRVKDAGSGSEDVEYAGYFSEYKKFDGRLHFTKLKVERDGKVVIDVERSEIKAAEKKADETFSKP